MVADICCESSRKEKRKWRNSRVLRFCKTLHNTDWACAPAFPVSACRLPVHKYYWRPEPPLKLLSLWISQGMKTAKEQNARQRKKWGRKRNRKRRERIQARTETGRQA